MQTSLSPRQQKILYRIVQDYIASAVPIGSENLTQRYGFGVSSATVRNEMGELADRGYLCKQHISSGRIPTMHAYRFFVDHVLHEEENDISARTKRAVEALHQTEAEDCPVAVRGIADALASFARTLTIAYLPGQDMVWREGMEYFLEEPEFSTHQALRDATIFAEHVHNIFFSALRDYFNRVENLQIFIGEENPFQNIEDREHYSMMIAPMRVGRQKRQAYFTLVGPLRMQYDSNISLLEYLMQEQE